MDKYTYGEEENREFLKKTAEELLNFGHAFSSPEGGAYYLGDDGSPWKDRPRYTWITCRMCHVYSIGHLMGHSGSRKLAEAALKGLNGELKDSVNGGWYAGIGADGNPLPAKQCYAHAFVILAACSALEAGCEGAKELLDLALETYDRYFWDEEEGLSCDTWDTEFVTCDPYRGINANMHSVEAFLAVADVCNDQEYRRRAGRIIDHVVLWAGENDWRIPEHFDENWNVLLEFNDDRKDDPFKPYGATPGHGIEWARLITQWAVSSFGTSDIDGPEDGRKYIDAARRMYSRAIKDGWMADGAPGIVYTTDWSGKPVIHDRMHWTLAEAINTSSVLYRVSGDEKYAADYSEFMEYLDKAVIDHNNGSWYHQLDRDNRLLETVWPGKSDLYHALQAMIIPYGEISISVIDQVKLLYSQS